MKAVSTPTILARPFPTAPPTSAWELAVGRQAYEHHIRSPGYQLSTSIRRWKCGVGRWNWNLEAETEYEMEAVSVDVEDGIGIWKQS